MNYRYLRREFYWTTLARITATAAAAAIPYPSYPTYADADADEVVIDAVFEDWRGGRHRSQSGREGDGGTTRMSGTVGHDLFYVGIEKRLVVVVEADCRTVHVHHGHDVVW